MRNEDVFKSIKNVEKLNRRKYIVTSWETTATGQINQVKLTKKGGSGKLR